jgi:hypothetical protein
VNHVWLRHFGAPLVADVTDFGLRSPHPRHAALLDWLAVEFRESGWSVKKLHRLIVTSAAYRMKSDGRPANAAIDPDNHLLWRANPRPLEAEAVRDCVLAAAGNLDLTAGGPEIPLTESETSRRRAVYFRHAHERRVKFLEALDAADPLGCYRRAETVAPHQALALLNAPLVVAQARALAATLADRPDAAFVTAAFETVLCRPPTPAEADRCRAYLADSGSRANVIHVLFNHPDFVTVR